MADKQPNNVSRRSFIQTSAAVASAVAVSSMGTNFAHAAGNDKIRVGLIGCGGRGTGAANDICSAENVQITALADVFDERIKHTRENLSKRGPEQYAVTDERCFVGFDAYKKVIASDVDLVILATPPGFRPAHIAAAVEAGKHIFAEKPVAVDPAGVRSVLASAEQIKAKNLGFVCGTQRRHSDNYIEIIKRIHDGAIGDIVAGQVYWNQGPLWMHPRQEKWTDMEWQLRNWLYFTWLSGDHIVEQHVHNIDVFNWAMNDHPISAYGMGGRQVRTDPAFGHIFDHFAIEFEYANGARLLSECRQIEGCDTRVAEHIVGTKGTSDPSAWIKGEKPYRFKKEKDDKSLAKPAPDLGPYQQEHVDLINSIRDGKPLNECKRIAETSLTAIMGRMSAYTGKTVTWQQAMDSKLDLTPAKLEMGTIAVPPVAIPGKDALV